MHFFFNNILEKKETYLTLQFQLDDKIRKIERIMGQKLLEDPGNDRQHANIIKTIEQRPANPLFDRSETETEENTSNNRPLEVYKYANHLDIITLSLMVCAWN